MRQVLSRQVLGKGVLTAAAASSLLSIVTGAAYAHPGAMAEASHSPGVLSGNSVSVPITLSPNVCGNSVDGGAALNPAMGNTCATTTGSDTHHAGQDYERYVSPEHAEAFERYLEEHQGGRHALPEQRREEPRHEEARRHVPRHAAPRHEESRHEGGYGGPDEEECDDHPHALPAPAPVAHHAPPAPQRPQPRPHPAPKPIPHPAPKPPVHEVPAPPQPAPAPAPLPAPVHEAPVPLPAPAPGPAPVEEAPRPLPAPAPVAEEAPVPAPPHGSQFVEHPAPAPAPAPEAVRPADQPPAAPAGDTPIHLAPAPAPAPVPVTPAAPAPVPAPTPAPAQVSAPELAETGAGQPGAAAALASALILGGAILYRRSRAA
ncbi:chaplin [Streptomyces sp. NBC_01006]|uniref:chaplin n=1 Tax=Streptomyces sp. NBC_01006 TaxID=2903716 RepID=UPI0038706286|nr:chaplin [Streptomyces sp. NBC_01006]